MVVTTEEIANGSGENNNPTDTTSGAVGTTQKTALPSKLKSGATSQDIIMLPRQKSRSGRRESRMYLVDGQLCWANPGDELGGHSSSFSISGSSSKRRQSSIGLMFGSSMDLAASIDSSGAGSEEAISYRIKWCRENIVQLKRQTWPMERKLQLLRASKLFIKQHQGELKQSKQAGDVLASFRGLFDRYWGRFKREFANFLVIITPWEMRIKKIESHFGSVVASYFTFLRWIFWLNLANSLVMTAFVMVPELIENQPDLTGMRKGELGMVQPQMAEPRTPPDFNPTLGEMWEFEGFLKFSPIFYGYYSNKEISRSGFWRNPLAFLISAMFTYLFCFFCISRKLSQNTKLSRIGTKDDEYTFCWTVFVGWDFMIGNSETAYNKTSSLVMNLKEGILEEKEQTKDRNWRLIIRRILANLLTIMLIVASAYVVTLAVQRSENLPDDASLLQKNELQLVMSGIQFMFPPLFDVIGIIEKYHPRKALSWQLGRILFLDFLNFYTLMFSLFGTVDQMGNQLNEVSGNITLLRKNTTYYNNLFTTTTTTTTIAPTNLTIAIYDNSTLSGSTSLSENVTRIMEIVNSTNVTSANISSQDQFSASPTTTNAPQTIGQTMEDTKSLETTTLVNRGETLSTTTTDANSVSNTLLPSKPPLLTGISSPEVTGTTPTAVLSSSTARSELADGAEDYPDVNEMLGKKPTTARNRRQTDQIDGSVDKLSSDQMPEREDDNLIAGTTTTTTTTTNTISTNRIATNEFGSPRFRRPYLIHIPPVKDPYKANRLDNGSNDTTFNFGFNLGDNIDDDLEEPLEGRLVVVPTRRPQSEYPTRRPKPGNSPGKARPIGGGLATSARARPQNKPQQSSTSAPKYEDDYDHEEVERDNFPGASSTGAPESSSDHPIAPKQSPDKIANRSTEENSLNYTSQPAIAQAKSALTGTFQVESAKAEATTLIPLTNNNNNISESSSKNGSVPGCFTLVELGSGNGSSNLTGGNSTILPVLLRDQNATMLNNTEECVDIPRFEHQEIIALNSTFRDKLKTLCWETMFGQEMVKIVVMDLVMTVVSAVSFEFMRACFVRYCNRFFFWDLERGFPGYQDFKIAENVLHLVNNQSTVWMGMFFAPGLPAINTVKLAVLMYVRSWAVLTCNIPHETVFKVSKSNNFYYWILLLNLLICILPVAYAVTWIRPSWHCGPFGGECRMYLVVTKLMKSMLPPEANSVFKYLTSPGAVIPILISLILIIYYLASTVSSSKEANKELKAQLKKDKDQEAAVPEITNTTVADPPSGPVVPPVGSQTNAPPQPDSTGQPISSTPATSGAGLQAPPTNPSRMGALADKLSAPAEGGGGAQTKVKSLLAPPGM